VTFFIYKKRHVKHRSSYLDSNHHSGQKIRVVDVFLLETHFQPRQLEITLLTFLNQSSTSKSAKNSQKLKINSETNFFQTSNLVFLGTFKVKKNPSQTFLIIWNHLEQKSNVLVAGIEKMTFSLSRSDSGHPLSLSLSSHPLRTKIWWKWTLVPKWNC